MLALQILYSQPYPKRRLTYASIRELALRLTDPPYHLTTADVWLMPLRYTLEGLMSFSGRPEMLDGHDAVMAYADVVHRDPHMGPVWREMEEALKTFMASRG